MKIGDRYRYRETDDPAIRKGTVVEIVGIEQRGIGIPYVYARKVSSKDEQEYIIMAHELEAL